MDNGLPDLDLYAHIKIAATVIGGMLILCTFIVASNIGMGRRW